MNKKHTQTQVGSLISISKTVIAVVEKALLVLERVEGFDDDKKELKRIIKKATEASIIVRDIENGTEAQRKKPLVDAWEKARKSNDGLDWTVAFEVLSEVSLGEENPSWYAGSMLSMLSPPWEFIGSEQASALVRPILQEMTLASEGYQWVFPANSDEAKKAWDLVCSLLV